MIKKKIKKENFKKINDNFSCKKFRKFKTFMSIVVNNQYTIEVKLDNED